MKSETRFYAGLVTIAVTLLISVASNAQTGKYYSKQQLSDESLIKKIPGFKNGYTEVNNVRMHYVIGGHGKTIVLLPGWPETWWEFHKMMPLLQKNYQVIVFDLRGMGGSGKPASGYDKKTMGKDIYDALHSLGITHAYIAGHDIGSQVAYSIAENHPDITEKLILLDVPHPDPNWATMPMLPALGANTSKLDETKAFPWWFAFNSVDNLGEELTIGRVGIVQKFMFRYLLRDESLVTAFDHAIYTAAYDNKNAIRAGNGYYKAWPQDIEDFKTYHKIEMPVLVIAGPFYEFFKYVLPNHATNYKLVRAEGSGHFIPEEKPQLAVGFINEFLQ